MSQSPYTSAELATANTVIRILDVFRSIDPEMTIGEVVSFLMISKSNGISPIDLNRHFGFSKAAASRYGQQLGSKGGRHKPGKDLITCRRDDLDARRKLLEVSPRGLLLLAQLRQVLNPGSARRRARFSKTGDQGQAAASEAS